MALANLILEQISDAGFAVVVTSSLPPELEGFQITATELATGLVTCVSDLSLTAASIRLADQLGVYCKLANEQVLLGYRAPLPPESQRLFPLPALIGLTAAVFLLDVATPGLNLGVVYVVPLILARRSRLGNRALLFYAALLMCLTFADHAVNQITHDFLAAAEPAELLNRSLAMGMIAATTGFILLYRGRQPHVVYGIDKSPRPTYIAPPMRASLNDRMVDRLTALLVGFTFMADIVCPQSINLAILYLVPLALVAIAYEHRAMWKLVGTLVALTLIGYFASPPANVTVQTSQLIVANRGIVCGAILLAALVLHIRSHAAAFHGVYKHPAR